MTINRILEVESLLVSFPTAVGQVRAVDGLDLTIHQGENWCLVGESGCGKTIVAMSLLRLLPPSAMVSGGIRFKGIDLLSLSQKAMQKLRGREISMIFEQPAAYLNPVFSVGNQISEAVRIQGSTSRRASKKKALQLLEEVGIISPSKCYRLYPHQLSGGMNQRVMIAMVLALEPALLIADEPTTSLDPTVQAQIIGLLNRIAQDHSTTLLVITHDYEVAAELCTHAAVMYAGRIMETGTVFEVFQKPRHPYTRAMLSALDGNELRPIPGTVPSLCEIPGGCRFHPRCAFAARRCAFEEPDFQGRVRCHAC